MWRGDTCPFYLWTNLMIVLILVFLNLTAIAIDAILRMKAKKEGRHIMTPHEFLEKMWEEEA
jgi:hypothetical protein